MKGQFFINIPYESRTQYIEAICEINSLVDADGMIVLAVNNNPYILESYLVVETNTNAEKISELINKYNLHNSTEKSIREIIIEMGNKRWNMMNLYQNSDSLEIKNMMKLLYFYAEKDELRDKGFYKEVYQPKIFISYCHMDCELVMDVYQRIQMAGMNCWIDMQDIDVGEIIAKKMLDGIRQCDYAIFFLSQAYKQSMMAKAELQNYLAYIFREKKSWYLIKVDDVDVDDIQPGLSNYKYYDLSVNHNLDDLVADINRVFKKN